MENADSHPLNRAAPTEPPFREYIGSMARELAVLARAECRGDESLATALEQAALLASAPRK